MKAIFRRTLAIAASAFLLAAGPSMAAVIHEFGDAGQSVDTAQVTAGNTLSITDIFGALPSGNDADLYIINVVDAAAFSATTVGGTSLDTQLFLFSATGAPIFANDDDPGGLSLGSSLPGLLANGLYILGISLSGYDPVNEVNQLLFETSALTTDLRGPAAGLQPATLAGFDGFPLDDAGRYRIQLTGAAAAVPEPSSVLLAGMAGLLCLATTKRRRRQSATRA